MFLVSYLLLVGILLDYVFIKINGGINYFFVLFYVSIGYCIYWYWYLLKVVLYMFYDDIYFVFNLFIENFEIF